MVDDFFFFFGGCMRGKGSESGTEEIDREKNQHT